MTRRHGIGLLEMVIVIGLMCLMMTFIATTLLTLLRVQQANTQLFQNMIRHNVLADRFRSDIAEADAAPGELGILRANPYCLILRMADGTHIIYHTAEQRLERLELNADLEPSAVKVYDYGDNRQAEFSQSVDGRLVTLRITEVQPRIGQKRTSEIQAALTPEKREKSL